MRHLCECSWSTFATRSSTRFRGRRGRPNGRLQVMGFPPIGIMSLSSVLKRAGHEVTMFDQANPETPNDVIVDEMRRQKPDLVGMSFLSTTSYPYAKMLARQLRAADSGVKLAFGGVFATLNAPAREGAMPRGRLRLSWRRRTTDRRSARAPERSRHGDRRDLAGKGRHASEQPEPRAAPRSRPVAVPGPREPAARLRRIDAARRPGGAVSRPLHDDADVARLPVAVRLLRHPDLQRRQVARADAGARDRGVRTAPQGWLRIGLLRRRPLPPPAQAHRGDLRRPHRREESDQIRARGTCGLGRAAPLPASSRSRAAGR